MTVALLSCSKRRLFLEEQYCEIKCEIFHVYEFEIIRIATFHSFSCIARAHQRACQSIYVHRTLPNAEHMFSIVFIRIIQPIALFVSYCGEIVACHYARNATSNTIHPDDDVRASFFITRLPLERYTSIYSNST